MSLCWLKLKLQYRSVFFLGNVNCQSLCNLLQASRVKPQLLCAAARGPFNLSADGIVSFPVVMEMRCLSLTMDVHMLLALNFVPVYMNIIFLFIVFKFENRHIHLRHSVALNT